MKFEYTFRYYFRNMKVFSRIISIFYVQYAPSTTFMRHAWLGNNEIMEDEKYTEIHMFICIHYYNFIIIALCLWLFVVVVVAV